MSGDKPPKLARDLTLYDRVFWKDRHCPITSLKLVSGGIAWCVEVTFFYDRARVEMVLGAHEEVPQ